MAEAEPHYRRRCPIDGCPTRLRGWRPFCARHWGMIPFLMQEDVQLGWFSRPRDPVAYLTALARAREAIHLRLHRAPPPRDETTNY